MIVRLFLALCALLGLAGEAAAQGKPPLVLAAASLQESLTAAADRWVALGHARPTLSFAASSTLARQVEAGAPADLFLSADQEWMDALAQRSLIVPASRVTFLGNQLVVVSRKDDPIRIPLAPARLGAMLGAGPLAMADDAVPAGKYGRASLEKMGVWAQVSPHVVRGDSVRAALALVERGAARLGIVYATDAIASPATHVAGVFPERTHPPILYPIARLKTSTSPEAEAFRRFLVSREGKAIFVRYGFTAK